MIRMPTIFGPIPVPNLACLGGSSLFMESLV